MSSPPSAKLSYPRLSRRELYCRIEELRSEYRLCLPVVPLQIARKLGIEVLFHRFDSQRIAGILMKNPGSSKAVILLNEARGPLSQTFTLAHELMHYWLHSAHGPFVCDPSLMETSALQPLEWQANEGAAQLLVPKADFLTQVRCKKTMFRLDPERAVAQLARRYQVSRQVIRYRLNTFAVPIAQLQDSAAPAAGKICTQHSAIPSSHSIDVLAD